MDRIAKLTYDSANQGGSSYHNLDKLIEDIKKKYNILNLINLLKF
jgi:hypothetical protein